MLFRRSPFAITLSPVKVRWRDAGGLRAARRLEHDDGLQHRVQPSELAPARFTKETETAAAGFCSAISEMRNKRLFYSPVRSTGRGNDGRDLGKSPGPVPSAGLTLLRRSRALPQGLCGPPSEK